MAALDELLMQSDALNVVLCKVCRHVKSAND